jgi:hypothetical protein
MGGYPLKNGYLVLPGTTKKPKVEKVRAARLTENANLVKTRDAKPWV